MFHQDYLKTEKKLLDQHLIILQVYTICIPMSLPSGFLKKFPVEYCEQENLIYINDMYNTIFTVFWKLKD